MVKYSVTFNHGESLPERSDFWRLHRDYNGVGGSAPEHDHNLLGKGHRVLIESQNPLTLEQLQADFSQISILSVRQVA